MILLELPKYQSPYFYAAAEEWLVRNGVFTDDVLLLYVNVPCVVIGKNQCIWKEVNWQYLFDTASTLVRRVSGGGTVYHDNGNLCFSFISPFEEYKVNNYRWFNQPIVDALAKMGVNATFSPRNDILYEGKKISGNAQFTNRKNILSHGTLLFSADLPKLKLALSANHFDVQTKAVSSVRSAVMNLCEVLPMSFATFYASIQNHLPITEHIQLSAEQLLAIQTLAEDQYVSPTWIIDKSPKANVRKQGISFAIENGLLVDIQSEYNPLVFLQLNGVKFNPAMVFQKLTALGIEAPMCENINNLLFL